MVSALRNLKLVFGVLVLCFYVGALLPESALAAPKHSQSTTQQNAFDKALKSYVELEKRDPNVGKLSEWKASAAQFSAFLKKYPRSVDAPHALYVLGRLYQQIHTEKNFKKSLKRAIAYFERLARDYEGHRFADDALLQLGDLRRNALDDETAARAAYYEIIDVYADGDMAKKAKQRLGLISEVEEEVEEDVVAKLLKTAPAEKEAETKKKEGPKQPLSSKAKKERKPVEKKNNLEIRASSRPLVVIDPGHGGDDFGALGRKGLYEKDVVLNIATYLDEMLRERMNARTVLTRMRDVTVPLDGRASIANEHQADLFISIHTNASPRHRAKGIETYYLDNTDDKSSLKLAERENEYFIRQTGDLQFMLSDLIQGAKLNDSISLAHYVQNSLMSRLAKYYKDVVDLGVKRAPFYVLVGAHMPCVLVEISFIDHPVEGKRLGQQRYQKLAADALYRGVRDYLESRN